jgi:septum formation protein
MLILASASPRRRELLARAGVVFEVAAAEIDESVRPGEAPRAYAERVAAEKAAAVAALRPDAWVLAADTIVVVQEDILGKAEDEREAAAMLARLSGRTHRVMTAFCLVGTARASDVVSTEVVMRALSEDEIDQYARSGEWRGKAGAYAAQGIAAAFITEIRGSYTNVVGLPLAEVLTALRRAGAATWDLSRGTPA